jgi:hypothetical protein
MRDGAEASGRARGRSRLGCALVTLALVAIFAVIVVGVIRLW